MRRKQVDTDMYMQGLYFREALLSSVCNNSLWMKKGSKPHEYPKKTFYETMEENRVKNKPLTEEEKKRQTELLFKRLSLMKTNYELTNSKNKKKNTD